MILDRILEHKRAELRHKESRGYLIDLKARIAGRLPPRGFKHALERSKRPSSPALIAEVKKASPSQGILRKDFEPSTIAKTYEEHGASAISVLTGQMFFQGCLENMRAVKEAVDLPVLNKEFMVEEIQFYEARAFGADAVLLIVAALERRQIQDLFALATELQLDVLFETHQERELDVVLEWLPDAQLIGINNRDLKTFATDLGVTFRLAKRIPSDKLIVSESGIHKRDDVLRLAEAEIGAMLVGETFMRAENIGAKVQELIRTSEKEEEEKEK